MNVYFQMLYQGLLYLDYNTCEFKSAQCWKKEKFHYPAQLYNYLLN